MACGTGKTLTALWIAEALKSQSTVIFVPSLLLLSKTLKDWLEQAAEPFLSLPVCSDESASNAEDAITQSTTDLAFPSTTDSAEIIHFLKKPGRKVIFSTYQSSPKVAEAFSKAKRDPVDLIIADEAHRCAGKVSSDYAVVLNDENIPSKRRLFMTATPRIYQAHLRKRAGESGVDIASMDDEAVFGPVLHRYSFSDAIENGKLTDYQVVVVGIDNSLYKEMIDERRLVETDNEIQTDAQSLASYIGLAKALKNYDLQRVITFHSRVKKAREFSSSLPAVIDWIPEDSRPGGELIAKYVSGAMPTSQRNTQLRALGEVHEGQRYVLANARCLTEGVDVPSLDGVAFIDPRNSEIDIVQAVGRAIRLSESKEVGTIVIPVFIDANEDPDVVLSSSVFKKVWAVVNALRSHDDELGEQLDSLRVQLGKRGTVGKPDKITFDLPAKIGQAFEQAIETKLLEATTASWEFWFGLLDEYKSETGHCLVPTHYKTKNGYKLGMWVSSQRNIKESLVSDRKDRLDDLGFVWDAFEDRWEKGYDELLVYRRDNGNCQVPSDYVTKNGFNLGVWVNNQRKLDGSLPEDRKLKLDRIGFVWDVLEENWEQNYSELEAYKAEHGDCLVPLRYVTDGGKKLGVWVSRQRKAKATTTADKIERLDRLGFVWDVRSDQWEHGFAQLKAFKEANGNCIVPKGFVTKDGFRLDYWVGVQRRYKHSFPSQRKKQLDEIGFVWDAKEERWEQYYGALKKYKETSGHCLVPARYVTESGLKLGVWVSRLRRRKSTLSEEKLEQLDSLEFVWDPLEDQWEDGYKELAKFKKDHGHCMVPKRYKSQSGFQLGIWIGRQRHNLANLTQDKKQQLDELGFIWDAVTEKWERGFSALKAYKETHGDCMVPQKFVPSDGYKLNNWMTVQRRNKETMSADKRQKLEELGFIWNTYELQWEQGFRSLESYRNAHEDCLVPAKYVTDDGYKLGGWVSGQRNNKDRLSDNQWKRLDEIGFVWDVKEFQWEKAVAELSSYKISHGDCLVPLRYKTESGFSLGKWVVRQRTMRDKLSSKRRQMLDELGFVWNPRDD